MKVKGISFVGRKKQIEDIYGKDRWNDFYSKITEKEPYFKHVITSSLIPFDSLLIFIEEFVKEFYSYDDNPYFKIGYDQAEWSLVKGPYKSLLQKRDLKSFIHVSLPTLWDIYFTEGKTEVYFDENKNMVTIHIFDIPVQHQYFVSVAGFVLRAFELLTGKEVKIEKIKDIMKDGEMKYNYYL